MILNNLPEGRPYTDTCPLNPPEANIYSLSYLPGGTYTFCAASPSTIFVAGLGLQPVNISPNPIKPGKTAVAAQFDILFIKLFIRLRMDITFIAPCHFRAGIP